MRKQWVPGGLLLLGIFLGIVGTVYCQFEFDYGDPDPPSGVFLPKDEFDKLYPPKDEEGKLLTQLEWDKLLEKATEDYEKRIKNAGRTSRAAPFCVDGWLPYGRFDVEDPKPYDKQEDPDLHNFFDILQEDYTDDRVLRAYASGKSNDTSTRKKEYIKSIEFWSIYSPDAPSQEQPDNIGIGRMNQWAHIRVTAARSLEGLYIQAISGPIGIPFGEFRTDFECDYEINGETKRTTVNHDEENIPSKANMVVPCKFAPRASIRHPQVYVYGGSTNANFPRKTEFHVHFNWEDVQCGEAERMQFLIVAVRNFNTKDYEILETISYEQKIDSGDGIPYPYYVQWNKTMTCKNDTYDNPKYEFKVHPKRSKFNIIYDEDYDRCIQITDFKDPKQIDKLLPMNYKAGDLITCPPGPFLCPNTNKISSVDEWETQREKDRNLTVGTCQIMHCLHPNESEPKLQIPGPRGFGTKLTHVEAVITRGIQAERESRATHAQMMILGWFMLMSVGISVARFYKETGGLNANGTNGCLGIGKWLWGHILISYAAAAVMWIGIIEIIHIHADGSIPCDKYLDKRLFSNNETEASQLNKACETRKGYIRVHAVIGFLSVACFHGCFATGWTRPVKTSSRKNFVLSHQVLGYVGKMLAFLSVVVLLGTNSVCSAIILEVLGLELVSIIILVALSFIQKTEDTKLGIPPRKQIPMIEAVEVPDGGSPYDGTKTILHVVAWILHIGLYLLVILTYFRIFGSGVTNPGSGYDTLEGGLFDKLDPLFGSECQIPSAKYDLRVLECSLDENNRKEFDCPDQV